MEENTNDLRKKVEDLYKERDFNGIVELLTDEVLETQKDAVLYGMRVKANFQLEKDIAKTMVYAEKAIAADPFNYIGYFARALVWANREKYINAVIDFSKAIELNMDFADAYYNRGLAWQNLNDKQKATADFDIAIIKYESAIENNPYDAELLLFRGIIWYYKEDFTKAIDDFTKAIKMNPYFIEAYYNSGLARFAKKEYDNSIKDYSKAIAFNSKYVETFYYDRGNAWQAQGQYDKAIADYTEAIEKNTQFENAYYYRGLARKERNEDINGSKQDFEKYLSLTSDDTDVGVRYAKFYLKRLKEVNDSALSEIIELVTKIKRILHINENCITHYTSLSAIKSLILDCSKFRLSEGNFMNDPSEGMEFFDYLGYPPSILNKDDSSVDYNLFSPKPFIGSFVTEGMHNDLNMWRFYGKEDGVEAKGCSITLKMQEYIDDIKTSLSNEKNKDARIDDESDINFYRVVYLQHKSTNFDIPTLKRKKITEFNNTMAELKRKVASYKGENLASLEEYLNYIAFLFKRADYKNENEVRLVMSGVEFEKKIDEQNKEKKPASPPRVYIELEPIKSRVEKITLGPKVDKSNEWASALYYSYKKEEKPPTIEISCLPYT